MFMGISPSFSFMVMAEKLTPVHLSIFPDLDQEWNSSPCLLASLYPLALHTN